MISNRTRIGVHNQPTLAQLQRLLNRLGQPSTTGLPCDQPIDNNVDRVLVMPLQIQIVGERNNLTVHPSTQVAAFQQVFE